MPIPEVELLAERVIAEAPQRGYRNAYSALLNWAKRERDNPRRQEPIPIIESPLQKQIRERRVGPT
jgi:hypothetical protein